MSEDTYKGESLQKKQARWATHLLSKTWMDELPRYRGVFERGLHAFLLSREGGDIGVLRALGVPFDNMLGIDRCESAARACADKWRSASDGDEGPHFVVGDADIELAGVRSCLSEFKDASYVRKEMGTGKPIGDCPEKAATGSCWTQRWAARSGHPHINSVFWDFCCHLDKNIVTAIADSWVRISVGSTFAVAVLKGREKRQSTQRSPMAPFANRRMRRVQRAQLGDANALLSSMVSGREPWDTAAVIRGFEAEHGKAPALARWRLIHDVLVMADPWRETIPEPIAIIEYQSRTADSCGVPMLIVSFAKRWSRDRHDVSLEPVRMRLSDPEAMKWRNRILSEHDNGTAALILNVAPLTASAWKAHATRGTYDKDAAAE